MIFVTVGTHEQQFDRLIQHIDEMNLNDEVFMQTGYSTYEPKHYRYSRLLSYKIMLEYVEKATIVITHGGPSSIMMPLQIGKVPIVVPRKKEFGEHVNNHQVEFTRRIEKKSNIIAVYDIDKIDACIENYEEMTIKKEAGVTNHNHQVEFNFRFSQIVEGMNANFKKYK
jgi:UDP-N-acetylglucosamine transferase subunit ALG13